MNSILEQYMYVMCSFFWGLQATPPTNLQKTTCEDVTIHSINTGEDPTMMLSIAWNESRFLPNRKSKAGAIGPMQVMAKYWCPKGKAKGCDLTAAGFKAWTTYFKMEKGNEEQALCRYNSGRKCKHSSKAKRYARKVLRTRENMVTTIYGTNWYQKFVDEQCSRCPECCVRVTDNGFIDEYGVERPHDWLPDE